MKSVKLHLGCGKRHIPGFVHIDVDQHPHLDYHHDIAKLPMFQDNSVELIYQCGVLVYWDRIQIVDVLKEWRRVLKPGGILRTSVVDFDVCARLYTERRFPLKNFVGPIFGRIETSSGVLYQKTIYDFAELKATLEEAGFHGVRRYDWRETEHAQIDDYSSAYLPHMDKENGALIMLNVEATK